jgi:hypothetical protein
MRLKDLQDLEMDILLPLLRNYGIYSYTIGGITITLEKNLAPSSDLSSTFEDEDLKLPCGHDLWESNFDGLCLRGCSPEIKKEDNN